MHRVFKWNSWLLIAIVFVVVSCKKDDNDRPEPPKDRTEEAQRSQADIESFLTTHFYNYEDFQNPPEGFDYKIIIDSISGDNANKTPLIEQVQHKTVIDRVEPDLSYKMYYLNVLQGEGDTLLFADAALLTYRGMDLERETFDLSNVPVQFDMTAVIAGFQEGLTEFNGASSYIEHEDGTITFENFGVGAVFIPTGLGYFNNPSIGSGLSLYSDLIFTFQLYAVVTDLDHDGDGVPSIEEDRNNNGILTDDDTDGDGTPDYLDEDDDGDGVPTRDEITNDDGVIEHPYINSNGNHLPDYLDPTYPYNN